MIKESEFVFSKNGNKIELFKNSEISDFPVLVVGVFHGDEPQGDYLIRKYIEENPDSNLLMIPCLNPDGMGINRGVKEGVVIKGTPKRTNGNGVDLNRNFPTKNWKKSDKNDYWGGDSPASETETIFLINVIEKYKPKAILTLHSPYKIVNYDGNAEVLAEKISEIIGYPVEKDIGYPTPGSFGTWAGIEKQIPTITLELDEEVSIKKLEAPVFNIFKMLENYKGN